MPDPAPNYRNLEKLLAAMDAQAMTQEEFVKAFEVVRQMITNLQLNNQKEFKLMQGAIDTLSVKLAADNSSDAQEMRNMCELMMQEWAAKIEIKVMEMDAAMDAADEKIEAMEDGEDARPEDVAPLVVPLVLAALPPDVEETGDEIIAKINDANDLIEPGAVRGLAELERQVGENTKNGTTGRIGWGAHPLVVKGLGSVIDKNTRVIDFEGSGVSSVTKSRDGIVTVTVSGGSGSFAVLVPTGTVNGINKTFVFTSTPQVIVLDNGNIMNKVSKDATVNWTGTTTVILTQAPNSNIFGF